MSTLAILEAIATQLKKKLPPLAVEYFPEKPADYRLNHPVGALLVSYLGSNFDKTEDIGAMMQPRTVKVSVTVVLRQLNGRGGAVDVLDNVRLALVGFKPRGCRKMRALSDSFLGETAGLWQYAADFSTETVQVEDTEAESGPPFKSLEPEEQS